MRSIVQILAGLIFTTFILAGCGSEKGHVAPTPWQSPPPKELYKQDRSQAPFFASQGPQAVDLAENNAFSKIFGGTSGAALNSYLDERIKHIVHTDETLEILPKDLMSNDYRGLKPEDDPSAADTILLGYNDGSSIWLKGQAMGVEPSVVIDNQVIPVTSPRTGIISLSRLYKTFDVYNGKLQTIPKEARYELLVHEARHSDCTGGLHDIFQYKHNPAAQYLMAHIPNSCTHGHIKCPDTHSLHGTYACDDETWGAYGIGAIYSLAAMYNLKENSFERNLLKIKAEDSLSRLVDFHDDDFKNSSPDMTSQDD